MNATLFMRIPFFVAGHQVTATNMDFIADFCEGHVVKSHDPFVRVPVNRVTHTRHTEAHVGSWVLLSFDVHNAKVYKVFPQEWLDGSFIQVPPALQVLLDYMMKEQPAAEPMTCCAGHPVHDNVRAMPSQGRTTPTPSNILKRTNR